MKTLVASLICLLIGYQIGRWLPQSQNIALTNKTEALEEQLKGGGAGGGASNMNILDTVLAAPRGGDITEVTSNTVKQAVLTTNETIVVTQFVEVVRIETNVIDSAADRRERWEKMSMEERMDQAQGMWEVRMDLARSGFFKKMKKAGLELNHKKRRDFQLIMDTMNYHMKTTIDNWVQTNGEKDKLYPDDGIGLMTDAMNVIKLNYGQMDAKMPEGWRDAAGDDFRLFDFIDPSVGGSLLQMENQLKPLNGRPQDRQGPPF